MSVEKFSAIFDGLEEAYGTYKIEKTSANGKNTGRAGVVKEPRTNKLWRDHLLGKGPSVGIIPINNKNMCKWGCIDVDQSPLDHKVLGAHIAIFFAKSGLTQRTCKKSFSTLPRLWDTETVKYFQNK